MLVKHIYIPLENRKAKGNKTLPKRKKNKKIKIKPFPPHTPHPQRKQRAQQVKGNTKQHAPKETRLKCAC